MQFYLTFHVSYLMIGILLRYETRISNLIWSCAFSCSTVLLSHPTHLTLHWPYSLSQPYDGKFSSFPMLTDDSAISISGLDNTGSPDIGIIHYKRRISTSTTSPSLDIRSSLMLYKLKGALSRNFRKTWKGKRYVLISDNLQTMIPFRIKVIYKWAEVTYCQVVGQGWHS